MEGGEYMKKLSKKRTNSNSVEAFGCFCGCGVSAVTHSTGGVASASGIGLCTCSSTPGNSASANQ
jgi:putative bacteriocin precursor